MKKKYQTVPYEHFFPPAKPDPTFPEQYNFVCVNDTDSLIRICQDFMQREGSGRKLAVDIESTGLSVESDETVGVSFCFEPTTAYYVPIRHKAGVNLAYKAFEHVRQLLYSACECIFFNARFDMRFLRAEGVELDKIKIYDVASAAWIADSNIRYPALKSSKGFDCSRHFLGWDMIGYEQALAGAIDLSYSDPISVTPYAAGDALATFHLEKKLQFIRRKHKFTVALDVKVNRPILLMEDTPTPIDLETVQHARSSAAGRLETLEQEIHSGFGKVFKISAPGQVATVLAEHGINTGQRTDSGKQMKTDIKTLARIADKHPCIEKIIKFKQLLKFVTSFCDPLLTEYREDLRGCRFAYHLTTTPTGRLAAGKDAKNPYFAEINIQAVDKADETNFKAVKLNSTMEGIKGWEFIPDPKGTCEGFSSETNVRRAYTAYPGHLWVHLDYKAQELRIPANLSGEPLWVDAFLEGKDPHLAVAERIWGKELAQVMRKYAKILNFGALFGGTEYTFARTIGCSIEKAREYLDLWWAGMKVLSRWRKTCENAAKKSGTVSTFFGRPRRVKHWFGQKSWSALGFAKRTTINTQVQGAGADIVKIALCKIYETLLSDPRNKGKIKLLSCIHDEINFSIVNEEPFFTKATLMIQQLMEFQIPGWRVPMLVDVSLGDSWGNIFPFTYNKINGWEPA